MVRDYMIENPMVTASDNEVEAVAYCEICGEAFAWYDTAYFDEDHAVLCEKCLLELHTRGFDD